MSSSALASLVKGLPEALQRQYDYEDPIARSGKHLMHSPFFKVILFNCIKMYSPALRRVFPKLALTQKAHYSKPIGRPLDIKRFVSLMKQITCNLLCRF